MENFIIHKNVKAALKEKIPVLALESTILAHGMPYPDNVDFANKAEKLILDNEAVPAAIAIINGRVHIGLDEKDLHFICSNKEVVKTSLRELGWVTAKKLSGATTVSATIHLAHAAGIDVFATGGIGGVHRNAHLTFDVSQDIIALSKIHMVVVSAGAKAILDLPKTLEMLETFSIPVLGYKTDEFPSFYSRASGLKLSATVSTPEDIASIFNHHKQMGLSSALLIANPVPLRDEIPKREMDFFINQALKNATKMDIVGKEITPFLLQNIVKQTGGRSLKTNKALGLNNIQLGIEISKALV
ncbi:MAG: pseudouridine-5'-phosphate glycosidase [Candidatus Marinimicrobia bacterium]|nr:pseudouridine-5'-phosphate glycosidase [Candidatus Neomarinimicrobiota bacterium]